MAKSSGSVRRQKKTEVSKVLKSIDPTAAIALAKGIPLSKIGYSVNPGYVKFIQGNSPADAILKTKEKFNPFIDNEYNKLSPQEMKAIRRYTDEEYVDINNVLRQNALDIAEPKLKDRIQHLTDALNKASLPFPMKLQRGTSEKEVRALSSQLGKADLKVGDVFTFKGFTSTGAAKDTGFSERPVQFNIAVPKGAKGLYVEHITENPCENEVILQRGLRFKLYSVRESGHKKIYDWVLYKEPR